MSEYLSKIYECLEKIETEEATNLKEASALVAKTIENDGIIFVFGCGNGSDLVNRNGSVRCRRFDYIAMLGLYESG